MHNSTHSDTPALATIQLRRPNGSTITHLHELPADDTFTAEDLSELADWMLSEVNADGFTACAVSYASPADAEGGAYSDALSDRLVRQHALEDVQAAFSAAGWA